MLRAMSDTPFWQSSALRYCSDTVQICLDCCCLQFHAMLNFVVPSLLGSLATFNCIFADPITRSQERNASAEEQRLGEERSKELNARVGASVHTAAACNA